MSTATAFVLLLSWSAEAPPPVDSAQGTATAAFAAINAEWKRAVRAYAAALDVAKTAEERQQVKAKLAPDPALFAARFLKLAEAHPGTDGELAALCWAAINAPESGPGKKALAVLAAGRLARATPAEIVAALNSSDSALPGNRRPLAPLVLDRARRSLDDPETARLLCWVCVAYENDESRKAPRPFAEAADLIVRRFADSPNIGHFCESLTLGGGPQPWAGEYEKHLRTILEKYRHRKVRVPAQFALAMVALAGGMDGEGQAEERLRRFVTDLDGRAQGSVEGYYLNAAKSELARIRECGLGKRAREIAGEDLDGKPMRLSDYRGKVVLLVFWASTCGPCMREVPHERELVERFRSRRFVLLGVNVDASKAEARKAALRTKMNWRSFWGGPGGVPAAAEWHLNGIPTVYVIDHTGVIRESGLHSTRLDARLERLVAEAERSKACP
jgi:thiol-disulfide isomerase/thioredoxin